MKPTVDISVPVCEILAAGNTALRLSRTALINKPPRYTLSPSNELGVVLRTEPIIMTTIVAFFNKPSRSFSQFLERLKPRGSLSCCLHLYLPFNNLRQQQINTFYIYVKCYNLLSPKYIVVLSLRFKGRQLLRIVFGRNRNETRSAEWSLAVRSVSVVMCSEVRYFIAFRPNAERELGLLPF